ncbi:MAG: HNH endonuclease [SAR324 cluster bacterium]|nr:HNH endonuclease [SAR324 cluster bacterium]
MKITGRSPSITNAFTNSIIPLIEPNFEDVKTVLEILEMDESSVQCSYCGDPSSEWDHFRPLIVDKKPTGFISEISNLVPSCGKCNQSKGNKNWKDWMLSGAKLSPKSRAITDLQQRIGRLEIFEKWRNPTMINFEDIVGREIWEVHTVHEENVLHAMRTAQQHADVIRSIILRNLEQ